MRFVTISTAASDSSAVKSTETAAAEPKSSCRSGSAEAEERMAAGEMCG